MITRKKRSFSAVLALVALSSVFAITAQPSPAAAHGPHQNGCTGVADSGQDFNFHRSCDRHDVCYHDKLFGDTKAGRKSCDIRFLNDMNAWCSLNTVNKSVKTGFGARAVYRTPRRVCKNRATLYYNGVRALGGRHF